MADQHLANLNKYKEICIQDEKDDLNLLLDVDNQQITSSKVEFIKNCKQNNLSFCPGSLQRILREFLSITTDQSVHALHHLSTTLDQVSTKQPQHDDCSTAMDEIYSSINSIQEIKSAVINLIQNDNQSNFAAQEQQIYFHYSNLMDPSVGHDLLSGCSWLDGFSQRFLNNVADIRQMLANVRASLIESDLMLKGPVSFICLIW